MPELLCESSPRTTFRGANIFVTGISFECGVSIRSLTGMEVPVNKVLSKSAHLDGFQSSLESFPLAFKEM